jgi:putative oxidoreductase
MSILAQDLDVASISTGLLIGRLVVGLGLAAHGAQKLFGWFGGHGLDGTGGYFESLGFRPGRLFATLAGFGEFSGGVLVALGLLGPVGPALMFAVMLVAMMQHWQNGFFAMNDGIELPLLYATAGVALAFTGPGMYSLDAVLGLGELSDARLEVLAIVIGAGAAVSTLALRRPAPASSH